MYGLADRITRSDSTLESDSAGAEIVPLFPRTGVLVVERDGSTTLELVRACLGDSCAIAVAPDAAGALAQVPDVRPGVVMIDLHIDPAQVDVLVDGLDADGLDAIPVITIDPSEPLNADSLRGRIAAALHVSRRVWFGGGLRSRMVA
jgi:hypothetical protein